MVHYIFVQEMAALKTSKPRCPTSMIPHTNGNDMTFWVLHIEITHAIVPIANGVDDHRVSRQQLLINDVYIMHEDIQGRMGGGRLLFILSFGQVDTDGASLQYRIIHITSQKG